jgi:hypothetical protein
MRATLVLILAAGAALGAVSVAPAQAGISRAVTVAGGEAVSVTAATARQAAGGAGSPGDPSTTILFTVNSGGLSLSVPPSATLGSGNAGTVVGASIGPCEVVDARALASASWTVTAAETDFASGINTIPASAATYTPGTVTTTGTITVTPATVTLSNASQTVLTGSAGVGSNSATWDPAVSVDIPVSAVTGTYSGTLTQSVA